VGVLIATSLDFARASTIADPIGDLLSTYTGPHDPGLDVVAHEVSIMGDRLVLFGRMAGPIAPTEAIGGLYLTGFDRGQGTARFLNSPPAPPIIGPNVLFDSVLRINPNGTGNFNNLAAGVSTPLNPADITISSNEYVARVPLALLLPASTRPPREWTYNLWPRNGAGMNVQVSDLAPDDGNSPVIPEPATGVLVGIGTLVLFGCGWHKRVLSVPGEVELPYANEVVETSCNWVRRLTLRWRHILTGQEPCAIAYGGLARSRGPAHPRHRWRPSLSK
jgi:hypothetical protein